MQECIQPLDHLIINKFIPTLLQAIITDQDGVSYSLPVKHRGLGIPILSEISEIHYEHSKSISAPLASVIIMQGSQIPDSKIINEIKYSKKKESDVLLKENIHIVNQKIDTQKRMLWTMRVNLVHHSDLVAPHLSSMIFPYTKQNSEIL